MPSHKDQHSRPKGLVPRLALSAALASGAVVLRFALRGYEVLAYILLAAAALVLIRLFVGGVVWKASCAAVAIVAVAVCVTQVPILGAARTDAPDDVGYIVVLGARVNEDGQPSRSLRYRLDSALAFLEGHPTCMAVLSGGQGDDEVMTEASCMYAWLVARGIDPDRLILEERAENTWQNLAYSFDLIRARGDEPSGNVAILSSNYHLCRAKLMASKLGVEAWGIAAYSGNPFLTLNYLIREAPALWKTYLFD